MPVLNYLYSTCVSVSLLFFFLNRSQAQQAVPPYSTQIDSIQQMLTKRNEADTLRVIQLYNLAQVCFRDLQFKHGLVATKEARILAKKLNYAKGEGLFLTTMQELNTDSFLWLYYKFKEIWFYADRQETVSTITLNLAAPAQTTNAEKATKELKVALAYFEQHPDAEITANILQLISYNYRRVNKDGKSMPYLDKAFKKFLEANQPITAYYLLVIKSVLLERSGKQN